MIDWISKAFFDAHNACNTLILLIDPNMPKPLAAGLSTALVVFITLKSLQFGFKIQKNTI
jgi:hypothetical protein